MASWPKAPWRLLNVAKGFWDWIRYLGLLGQRPQEGALLSAQHFLQEREAWVGLMNAVQWSAQGSRAVMEGLARRHGDARPGAAEPRLDEDLLRQLSPLIWFFHTQKDRFPENTVGHGCAVGLLHTLFQAAQVGASREDVIRAVRQELDAQLDDACQWGGPVGPGGDVWVS